MLYIYTDNIKYSTVGASFSVSFSVAPDEVGYLQKIYDTFKAMNMCGISLTAQRAEQTEPMIYPQVDGITPSVIQTEPKFDKDINVRSKYKQGTWLYGDGVYCSCCGYKLETTALLAKCPKCGADMSKTDCAWKKGE